MLEGRADLGIITSGSRIPLGLYGHRWRKDRLLAVVTSNHPLASCASVSFEEVLRYPLIGAVARGTLALLLEDRAERLGRRVRYRFHVESTDAARRLAAAGHGITVMPDGLVRPYEATFGLRGIPIAERWAHRQLRLVARAPDMLPVPARLLLDHLLKPAKVSDTKPSPTADAPPAA